MERIGLTCALVLFACGPVVDIGPGTDDDDSGTDEATTASTSTSASSSTSPMTSSSTSVATTVEPTTATTDEPPPPPVDGGYCTPTCETPIDCCMGEPTCEAGLGTYPYNYGCDDGTCIFGGCTSDEDCTFGGVLEGYICVENDGFDACIPACDNDQDCEDQFLTGWVCNGTYCEQPSCSSDEECGPDLTCSPEVGTCIYACTSDESCAGFGHCDPERGLCVCSSDDECTEGYDCQPPP